MGKFEEELKKESNLWIKRIGNYLLSREDIKKNLEKENKSLRECFDYILIELSIKSKKENGVGYIAGDDEEIYALAVHYYDEDSIKVGKKNFTTNADGSADPQKISNKKKPVHKEKVPNEVSQKAIDDAVAAALEKYKKEEKEKEKQRKAEIKKQKEEFKAHKLLDKKRDNDNQLSIFDM